MFGRTFGIVAASALTAQAFLIPAGVNSVDGDLSTWTPIDTRSQAIKLPCPECVFSAPKEEKVEGDNLDNTFWIQGGANSLKLNFSISEDGHTMGMDDYQLYPMVMRHPEKPSVNQIASSADVNDLSVATTSVKATGETTLIEEDRHTREGDSLVFVTYQMLQVEYQPISVDGARITMLKDAEGTLSLLSVEAVPKARTIFDGLPGSPGMAHVPATPVEPAKDCANLPAFICEWKNLFGSKLDDVKASMPKIKGGCKGKGKGMHLPGHIKPHLPQLDADGEPVFPVGPPPHGMRPHHGHHGPHHHGHHHGHRHHFWRRFLRGVVMVLVPVMAGMTMGMTVGLVGMLMGRLVSFLWIKFVRGGRRGYASVAQQETAEDVEIVYEKSDIEAEDAEPLPLYEEAPAYEETEQK